MLIIPAIDIEGGKVVRLFQGKFSEKKVYSNDPVKTAQHWIRQGARMLHVVDLDGASSGVPRNIPFVKKITAASSVPVQCGGGARSIEAIESLLEAGVARVVLGTRAVQDRKFLKKAFIKFGEKIMVSIDAKDGAVCIQGWQKASKAQDATSFAQELKGIGFTQVIYTDISKDGTLHGPSIKQIKALLKSTDLRIIASWGVSSLDDIARLKLLEKDGVIGVIIGKALYEGRFTLAQGLLAAGQT